MASVTFLTVDAPCNVIYKEVLPFRVRFSSIGIPGIVGLVPPIGIAIIGQNNYILWYNLKMAIVPIDLLKTKFETGDRPTGADYTDLIDTATFHSRALGVASNNESIITGIENPTIFDTIDTTIWRTIKYVIQLSNQSSSIYESTEINIVFDGTNVNLTEYNMVSNSDQTIATVSASLNNSTISMTVTPLIRPATIRFYRTGLKAWPP